MECVCVCVCVCVGGGGRRRKKGKHMKNTELDGKTASSALLTVSLFTLRSEYHISKI